MHKKYKALIYDWDGCLINSLPTWIAAYKNILSKVGVKSSESEIIKVLGNQTALESLGHPDPEKAKAEFQESLNKRITKAELYPGVIELLKEIKERNVKLFLATSSPKKTFELSKSNKSVDKYFDYSVFADDVNFYKPDPQAINIIIDKFKILKSEVLMIGDSDKDILAARNAGIDSVWFAPKKNGLIHNFDYLGSLKPTWKIESHNEITSLV